MHKRKHRSPRKKSKFFHQCLTSGIRWKEVLPASDVRSGRLPAAGVLGWSCLLRRRLHNYPPDFSKALEDRNPLLEGLPNYKRPTANSAIQQKDYNLRARVTTPPQLCADLLPVATTCDHLAMMMHMPMFVLDQLFENQETSSVGCLPTSCRPSARAAAR